MNLGLTMFFSRENLPAIKDGSYVIHFGDKQSKETHWVLLFIDRNTTIYLDTFGIEHIHHEVVNKIKDKSIAHNIFRIQDIDSIMCRFYCIAFIEHMPAEKSLLNYIFS